jgi:Glutathionylspermidine synthase preATP-grasp
LPFLVSRLLGIERRIFVVLPFGLGFVERGHNQHLAIRLRRHFTWRLWVDRPGLCFPRRLTRATMQRIPIDERANWRDRAEKTGANVEIVIDGSVIDADDGPYGDEPKILQTVAPLPVFDGNYTVLGSWIAAGIPAGLSVREDAGPITKNTSRFLPHAIIG